MEDKGIFRKETKQAMRRIRILRMTHEAIEQFEIRYKEILELAKKEYEYEPPTNYYKDGYNLYERLDKYRDSLLLFLHDVRVPTNNNLCQRKGRAFKRKQRQVMAFRSFDSLTYLCSSMSIIDLLSAKEDNLFKRLQQY